MKINARHLNQEKYDATQSFNLNGWFLITCVGMFFNKGPTRGAWGGKTYVHLVDGVPHKEDGPAMVSQEFNEFRKVIYFYKGLLHNHKGYSSITYDSKVTYDGYNFVPSNKAKINKYSIHVNGDLHSLEGPSKYSKFEATQKKYYINGNVILMKDFLKHPQVLELKKTKQIKEKMKSVFID